MVVEQVSILLAQKQLDRLTYRGRLVQYPAPAAVIKLICKKALLKVDELKLKVTDLLSELNELLSGLCEGGKVCK